MNIEQTKATKAGFQIIEVDMLDRLAEKAAKLAAKDSRTTPNKQPTKHWLQLAIW